MSATTIQLPATGSNSTYIRKSINLPTSGAWLGAVTVSMTTANAAANIADFYLVWSDAHVVGTHYYRRTGGSVGSWQNWTLNPEERMTRLLFAHETIALVKYASVNDISFCIETTRSTPLPNAHPDKTGPTSYSTDGTIFYATSCPT